SFVNLSVYSVTGADTGSPISATANNTSTTSPVARSITIPTNGGLVGFCTQSGIGDLQSFAWTNAAKDVDEHNSDNFGVDPYSSAHSTTAGSPSVSVAAPYSAPSLVLLLVAIKVATGIKFVPNDFVMPPFVRNVLTGY